MITYYLFQFQTNLVGN